MIKNVFVGASITFGFVYLFTMGPDFKSLTRLHEVERQETLEDRKYLDEKKDVALQKHMECYSKAEGSYEVNWSRACRSYNEQKVKDCIIAGITEPTCRSKFVFDADCELPERKANYVIGLEDKAKQQCQDIFHVMTAPITSNK